MAAKLHLHFVNWLLWKAQEEGSKGVVVSHVERIFPLSSIFVLFSFCWPVTMFVSLSRPSAGV